MFPMPSHCSPRSIAMELLRIFGANVRQHRRAQRLTLEELAAATGLSRETIGKIERGAAAPLFETAEKIASALGLHPTSLFLTTPELPGMRGQHITAINQTLADLNEDQLARVEKMLRAFAGR